MTENTPQVLLTVLSIIYSRADLIGFGDNKISQTPSGGKKEQFYAHAEIKELACK
jgi:hypothetical protein